MSVENQLTTDTIRTIAWRAQTIEERIEMLNQAGEIPQNKRKEKKGKQFIADWIETSYYENRDAFEERLKLAGISQSECVTAYEIDIWPSDVSLPSWTADLRSFIADVTEREPTARAPAYAQPFEHILQSWVDFAYERLSEKTTTPRLSQSAITSLKEWLLSRLSDIASRALYVEFRTFATMRDPELLVREGDSSATDHYDAFTRYMHTDTGLSSLFTDFPVLARFLQTTIRQWESAVAEFNNRLNRDWSSLLETSELTSWPKTVSNIEVLTGDRHQDGRSVIRVDITETQSVIYKPRSTAYENALYDILSHIYQYIDLDIEIAWVLDRKEYGWVEHVSHEPCKNTEQVVNYYQRTGVLIGLSYFLYINDCHYENLIAHGEYPFVADAETILHPRERQPNGEKLLHDELNGSVLWTELLPMARSNEEVEGINLAGLAWPAITKGSGPQSIVWEDINTDGMKLIEGEPQVSTVDKPENIPTTDGSVQTVEDYVSEILCGFDTVVTIVKNDDRSLVPPELEQQLERLSPRYLHRSTRLYASLINRVTDPEVLQDGVEVTRTLEILLSSENEYNLNHDEWVLYTTERTALLRLDVPRFTMDENEDLSESGVKPIAEFVSARSIASKHRRTNPDMEDIQKQRELIQSAITPGETPQPSTPLFPADEINTSPPELQDRIKDVVRQLYSQLIEARQTNNNGISTWIVRANTENGLDVRLTENGLYNGRAGIAVFFALVAQQLNVEGAADAALDALEPLHKGTSNPLHRDQIDLGMASGLGGHIYTLTFVGRTLDKPSLIDQAATLSAELTEEHLTRERSYDVLEGTAGLLLALLALHEQRPSDRLRNLLVACGDHLLDHRTQTDIGYRVWVSELGSKPLTGFSHGTAGIAYALIRLSEVTKEQRFRSAAREAIAYERSVYDEEEKNWPDYRDEPVSYMDAWCHGRTGIVLSRAGIVDRIDHVREELLTAADHIRAGTGPETDQLCCGNAGRIDTLITLSETFNNNHFYARANQLATRLYERAEQDGSLALPAHGMRIHNPTLFQGVSGVGYALLRLQAPSDIPCLLLWE